MKIELITFDCAQTLVEVDWVPHRFAIECARELGLTLDEPVAGEIYQWLLQTRWREYQAINCTRNHALCRAWWEELTADWLERIGADVGSLVPLMEIADRRMYGAESEVFKLYPDTLPALTELKDKGYRLAVVSNWDYSLHRVLQMHQAYDLFDVVVASLEEGIEKPDPRVFELALVRARVSAGRALHVGDDQHDDVHGARSAGMKALLIDRSLPEPQAGAITSLFEIEGALAWTR